MPDARAVAVLEAATEVEIAKLERAASRRLSSSASLGRPLGTPYRLRRRLGRYDGSSSRIPIRFSPPVPRRGRRPGCSPRGTQSSGPSSGSAPARLTLLGVEGRRLHGLGAGGPAGSASSATSNLWDGRRHPMRCAAKCGVLGAVPARGSIGPARYKFEIRTPEGWLLPHQGRSLWRRRRAQAREPSRRSSHRRPPAAARPIRRARRRANALDAPVGDSTRCISGRGGAQAGGGQTASSPGREPRRRTGAPTSPEMGFTTCRACCRSASIPSTASWGYQPVGLYAPTGPLRPPGRFSIAWSERFHAAGIGVLLDWVPGHFPQRPAWPSRSSTATHSLTSTRIRGRGRASRLGHADLQLWPPRGAELPHRQRPLTGWSAIGVDGLARRCRRLDALSSTTAAGPRGMDSQPVWPGRENLEAIDFLRRLNMLVGGRAFPAPS